VSFVRLARLPLLLALGAALVGCDSGDVDAGGGTRIEDLPSEALIVQSASGEPTTEDAAAFLELLPFEPLYPSEVPGDLELALATIYPSPLFERDGDHALNTLWLEYRGDGGETDWVTVTQRMLPSTVGGTLPTRIVEVDGFEGTLVDLPRTEAIQLFVYACDLTITLMSHVLTEDEMVAMAASMIGGCPRPSEG